MSQCMIFPTMWYVRSTKPQISLRIRAVWSEPLLVALYSMIVKLLTEHHLECLSLKGGCTGWSESTHVKMPTLLQISCTGSNKKRRWLTNKELMSIWIPALLGKVQIFNPRATPLFCQRRFFYCENTKYTFADIRGMHRFVLCWQVPNTLADR